MSLYRAENYNSLYGDGTEVPDENLVAIDENNFPDTTFRSYVAENFDTNQDNQLSVAEGPSENFV